MSESNESEDSSGSDKSVEEPAQSNVAQMSDHESPAESGLASSLEGGNLNMLMDIPVTVSMELGRTRLSIKELLSLNAGAVIELQRLASEPMEILVNGTLVAHGEAVRVGERYGVRLTSVVSTGERIKQVVT